MVISHPFSRLQHTALLAASLAFVVLLIVAPLLG